MIYEARLGYDIIHNWWKDGMVWCWN